MTRPGWVRVDCHLHTAASGDAVTTIDELGERAEPPAVMAEAALMLCHRDPQSLTGRITYSQDLLAELGVPIPQAG